MHPSTPKYVQLIETLKADIQQGNLVAGQQLPNEDEIASQYGMSRGTVRKAIAELQRMDLLRKEQGRGTFVNEPKPVLNGFSLAEIDSSVQARNRITATETLLFEVIPANHATAEKLDIPQGNDVIHVVQLKLASGQPFVYEERFFGKSLCPDITAEMIEQHPIHRVLIDKYQIPLIRLSHTIEIESLPEDKLELFKVDEAVTVFAVDRLSFTRIDDIVCPAVWYQALYRADEYQFQAQFHMSI